MRKFGDSVAVTVLACLMLMAGYARSAEYYVDKAHPRASDSNPGSEESPWLTIQKAATLMKAGDTCFVMPGTYDERVMSSKSGEPGRFITYKARGIVIVRGFHLNSCTYVRIIGFEITQTASFLYPAVLLSAAHHCQVLDNNIHHTSTIGIFFGKQAPSNNVVIRGNTLAYIGSVPGREMGEIAILVAGNRNIVEYNDVSHIADFTNVWGQQNIIRNNYFHDNALSDLPDFLNKYPGGHHIDGLQYYSDKVAPLTRTLMENNLIVDNNVPHAHVLIMRNIRGHESSEFLFRGNVAIRNGAYGVMAESFPNVRVIQNTFVDMLNQQTPKARYCLQFTNGSTGVRILNNIFYNSSRPEGMTFYLDESSRPGFIADSNLLFRSGNPVQRRGLYKNPSFSDPGKDDYHLLSDSPAIDAGAALTSTAAAGQGKTTPVLDAGYFSDGWGVSEGDWIRVGSASPAQIIRIDYPQNTIEVEQPITWKKNDAVHLDYQGRSPDIGAFEYRAGNQEFSISITSPAEGFSANGPVPVLAEVSDVSSVRYVVFYINGIPAKQLHKGPYAFTWNPSGLAPGSYSIEARAYARDADPRLSRSSKITVKIEPPGGARGR